MVEFFYDTEAAEVQFLARPPVMKLCTGCGVVTDDFAISQRNKDGTQNRCRSCNSLYSRARYQRIKSRRLEQNRNWGLKNKERIQEYKQSHSCTDCGNSDWRVLEFDHLRDKIAGIADKMKSWSWDRLQAEIEKCELVCANCHRIRTIERRISSRSELEITSSS